MSNSINPILSSSASMVVSFANREPQDRGNDLMNAAERQHAIGEPQISLFEMASDLRIQENDSTDKKIIKVSTIVGAIGGGVGAAIPTGGAAVGFGIAAGGIAGFVVGLGIVEIKKSIEQQRCTIL